MWVYKITNLKNQKCYVGITNNIENRWNTHKNCINCLKLKNPLYQAFRKYGLENFSFEIIEDNITDVTILGEKERFYIKLYNSHVSQHGYNLTWGGERCQYDGNPRTKLTIEDVVEIRTYYKDCKIGVSDCWKLYSDKISYSAFEKIWEGQTWKGLMMEVYTEENKNNHAILMGKKNSGESNVNALYSDSEVLEIRKYYVTHSLQETYKKYGVKSKTKQGFRSLVDRSYLHLPKYSKIKKQWFLKDLQINIDDYNPVSTISGSGE